MRVSSAFIAAILSAGCNLQAKTPAQLKADLASIMPAGMKARLAWFQGGTWSVYRESNVIRDLYVTDSDDGQIRKLTNGTIGVWVPAITADGSRVVYGDVRGGRIYVRNFDGSGQQTQIGPGGIRMLGYSYNAGTKAHYVYHNYSYGYGNIERINIDTKESTTMYTAGAEGGPWIGISQDGTRMAARFGSNCPGTVPIPNGTRTTSSCGGCGIDMAPDNSYDYLIHSDASYKIGHHAIRILNGSSQKELIDTRPVYEFFSNRNEYNDARWTTHRDLVTFSWMSVDKNPIIYNLRTKAFVYIDDVGTTHADHLHVRFLPKGTVGTIRHRHTAARPNLGQDGLETFATNGRRVNAHSVASPSAARCVALVRSRQEASSNLRIVLVNQ